MSSAIGATYTRIVQDLEACISDPQISEDRVAEVYSAAQLLHGPVEQPSGLRRAVVSLMNDFVYKNSSKFLYSVQLLILVRFELLLSNFNACFFFDCSDNG